MKPTCLLPLLVTLAAACSELNDNDDEHAPALRPEEPTPAELLAGERLFLEPRFAQFFEANAAGDLNTPLVAGDPVLDRIVLNGVPQPGPFADSTMSCSACHMVDQALDLPGGGMRTYDDFAVGSPVTARPDGLLRTVRNSPPLVNASIARAGETVFHLDAEFTTLEELSLETLLGRNYGWLASERAQAVAHVAAVVRADDGMGELAGEFGGVRYADLLDLNAVGVPPEYALPASFRIDLGVASDLEIAQAVADLIARYTGDLAFARDEQDLYSGSPYDRFLALNHLPQAPNAGESPLAYAGRLAVAVEALRQPVYVKGQPQGFAFHQHAFVFGQEELDGLRVFLRGPRSPRGFGAVGNCAACHTPPDFTDFLFHNAGFAQAEHDTVHGPGAFEALAAPDLATRDADPDTWLPPSQAHPGAASPFRATIDPSAPGRTDLGLWNVFLNQELPAPQPSIALMLGQVHGPAFGALTPAQQLPLTEALFKTPSLRDLSHSGPYGHSGFFRTIDEVLFHYVDFSGLARAGYVRNADPRLMEIELTVADVASLKAFLAALDEDYE